MSKMPEALLMAGRLREAERYTQGARVATQVAAAAELRRLYAVNAELLEALDTLTAELEQLRGQRAGCAYPNCLDGGGRCHAMFKGECAGPKQERTTI